jgi:hypothetical protein
MCGVHSRRLLKERKDIVKIPQEVKGWGMAQGLRLTPAVMMFWISSTGTMACFLASVLASGRGRGLASEALGTGGLRLISDGRFSFSLSALGGGSIPALDGRLSALGVLMLDRTEAVGPLALGAAALVGEGAAYRGGQGRGQQRQRQEISLMSTQPRACREYMDKCSPNEK